MHGTVRSMAGRLVYKLARGAIAGNSNLRSYGGCRELHTSPHRSSPAQPLATGCTRLQPKFVEKAASLTADIIMFDLEDAVAPDEKEQARRNVVQAINDLDWGERTLSVRINGLDTPFMYRDVIEVAEQAGDRLDLIMLPKTGTAGDVYTVDVL